ncbi:DKNYY domain-containing protein [Oligoflexus tunisiensis]|uniref:DKNYY domain-containing protein n=1 Tax=Oligoflexus tunisiensis TaxID=708132 RepID=UPI00159F2577|nr:DKNYY domain-containing protein [Oligoflexus tunisiensis]
MFSVLAILLAFHSACTKVSPASQGIWNDSVSLVELILTDKLEVCGEEKIFTYPMSGRQLTAKRIELFKSIKPIRFDASCPGTDSLVSREALVMSPGAPGEILYATNRDACLYSRNFQGELRILSDADFARILSELTPKRIGLRNYKKNETDVFYGPEFDSERGPFGIVLEGAEPTHFQPYGDLYGKDEVSVWYMENRIDGAAPSTFTPQDQGWSRDASHIFFKGVALPDVDLNSFQIIRGNYSKDQKSVYYESRKIAGVDPLTFQAYALGTYSRDRDLIIFDDKVLEGVDSATFTVTLHYARDARSIYFGGKRLDLDPTTFKDFNNGYFGDANKVYFQDIQLAGADPASFETTPCLGLVGTNAQALTLQCRYSDSSCIAKDRNHQYRNGIRLP